MEFLICLGFYRSINSPRSFLPIDLLIHSSSISSSKSLRKHNPCNLVLCVFTSSLPSFLWVMSVFSGWVRVWVWGFTYIFSCSFRYYSSRELSIQVFWRLPLTCESQVEFRSCFCFWTSFSTRLPVSHYRVSSQTFPRHTTSTFTETSTYTDYFIIRHVNTSVFGPFVVQGSFGR